MLNGVENQSGIFKVLNINNYFFKIIYALKLLRLTFQYYITSYFIKRAFGPKK